MLFYFLFLLTSAYANGNESEIWKNVCCNKAETERCLRACQTATNPSDVNEHCRRSDELDLLSCISKHEKGEECCGLARRQDCHHTCRRWLRSPAHVSKSHLSKVCSGTVMKCLDNIMRPAPTIETTSKNSHSVCCEKTPDVKCKEACKKMLNNKPSDYDVRELRSAGCPNWHPLDKMTQCFLGSGKELARSGGSQISRIGINPLLLHCCSKSSSLKCKKLCHKTFSTDWTKTWDVFNRDCLTTFEENLSQCIDEVENPCEQGCDKLSFCENFNGRPTESFRSCTTASDIAASKEVSKWIQSGTLSLQSTDLPIKNSTNCDITTWRTIACTLQIKPCDRSTQSTRICKEDCIKVLSACLDWVKLPSLSPESVCSAFSSDSNNSCVSFASYFEQGTSKTDSLTRPCKLNPCANKSSVCEINECGSSKCKPYTCSPGCKLGEASFNVIPIGSYVRIPTTLEKSDKKCFKVCQCTNRGFDSNCISNSCFQHDLCRRGNNERIEHGSSYYQDCNLCSCYAGEIICSKRQCVPSGITDVPFTTLPCNCSTVFEPVCGWNGVTYLNPCLARCVGMMDFDFKNGSCGSLNPCLENYCSEAETCIPRRQVCLTSIQKNCPQYQCVNGVTPCESQPENRVCSIGGYEHRNPCFMIRESMQLAYRGPCREDCDNEKPVCGTDGNTYDSECIANSRMVTVDYTGHCKYIGTVKTEPVIECAVCPQLPKCVGITPPGACCPVCAGAVKLLYSQKQIDKTQSSLNAIDVFTLETMLRALYRQIQVAECKLNGHLTMEKDLLILVMPKNKTPTQTELDACVNEAENLAILVQRSSPRIVSEVPLNFLITATIVHSPIPGSGSGAFKLAPSYLLFIIIFLFAR